MGKLNTRGAKKTTKGNRITRKGLPKKSGGIGLHITGVSKRHFKTNAQKKKIRFSDGTVRTMWVKASDLKAGKYDNPRKEDFFA
jgi:large subunit ribosomal protein L28